MNKYISLENFLSTNNNERIHVIICNRKSVGNVLLRQYNRWDNKPVWNTKTMSIAEITKELILAYSINQGNSYVPKFITNSGTDYSIMNILNDGSYNTFPKGTISIATAREIRMILNEMRLNEIDDTVSIDNNQKLDDIKDILHKLTIQLERDNVYDPVKCVTSAIEILENIDTNTLNFLMPWTRNVLLASLETDRWHQKEIELVRLLAKVSSNNSESVYTIKFLPDSNCAESHFHKSYGAANEIHFVGNEIMDNKIHKARLPFSDVAIYYSSSEYLSHIQGTLDSMRIPYSTNAKIYAKSLNICRLMNAILESAQNDYSYAGLENAIRNPLFTFTNVTPYYVSPLRNYRRVLIDGIGWGRERYLNYYKKTMSDDEVKLLEKAKISDIEKIEDEEKKIEILNALQTELFANMLKEYVEIFEANDGTSYSVSKMLDNLWSFVCKYTYPSNQEKKIFKKSITEKISDLESINDTLYSTSTDKLSFLYEILDKLRVDVASDDNGVLVESLDNFTIMERKYNYIVGLSANSLTLDIKESPLLLDYEKQLLYKSHNIEMSPIDLACTRNKKRNTDIYNSLNTLTMQKQNKPIVHFSYSYYDTQNLRDSAPSIPYNELSAHSKEDEENIPVYSDWDNYIRKNIIINEDNLVESIKDKVKEVELKKDELKKKMEAKSKKRFEAEQDSLLSNVLHIDDEEDSNETSDTDDLDAYDYILESKPKKSEETEKVEKLISFSSTSIQEMLGCPLKYYYHNIKHLSADNQITLEPHQWLPPAKRGNLCHYFLEQYIKEVMPNKDNRVNVTKEPQYDVIDKLYDNAINDILAQIPYPSEVIFNREKKEYKESLTKYLTYVHQRWYEDSSKKKNWKNIDCEKEFKLNSSISGKKIQYHGYIDRVDGYIDQDGVLNIRIIDYKSGKREKKEMEIMLGIQIQHVLYSKAMEVYCNSDEGNSELNKLFEDELSALSINSFKKINFEWVGYTFPNEEPKNYLLDTTDKIFNDDNNINYPANVNHKIDNTIGKMLNEEWDGLSEEFEKIIYDNINDYNMLIGDNSSSVSKIQSLEDFCNKQYCIYKNVCRKWIGNNGLGIATTNDIEEESEDEYFNHN